MNLEKTAGVAIILGVVVYVLAMVVSPRLYQEPDISRRVAIIEDNRSRWNVSQIMFALGMGVPALGFLLLTLHLHGVHRQWTLYAGAASFILGALLGVIFVYRQTFDPVQYWENSQPSWLIIGSVLLTLAGLFVYGVTFLNSDYPNWSGYLAAGSAIILLVAFVLTKGASGFFVASLSYLVTLVMGIVLVF